MRIGRRTFWKNSPHLLAPSPTPQPGWFILIQTIKVILYKSLNWDTGNRRIGLFSGFIIFSRTPGSLIARRQLHNLEIVFQSSGFRTPRDSRGVRENSNFVILPPPPPFKPPALIQRTPGWLLNLSRLPTISETKLRMLDIQSLLLIPLCIFMFCVLSVV